MTTYVISTSHGKYCTTAESLSAIKEQLAVEAKIACWWYDVSGVRFEETFIFIEPPTFICSESDVP